MKEKAKFQTSQLVLAGMCELLGQSSGSFGEDASKKCFIQHSLL
jgi:hypothetical protein